MRTSSIHAYRLGVAVLVLAMLGACSSVDPTAEPTPEPTPEDPGPLEPLFSFVIIADPHIAGPLEHETRLQAAVDWVNANAEAESIELVVVLGDIGWGTRLEASYELLAQLAPPWVPIMGDNVLHSSGDDGFAEMFGPQLDALADTLDGWEQAPWPVYDERLSDDAWLQNLRFEHRGVRFVGLDWNIRHLTGTLAEFGDFNDVPGGSWEWLEDSLVDAEERADESVVILSHVPLLPGVFSLDERARFAELIGPVRSKVFGNLAGHLHIDYFERFPVEGYSTWVTDATWDDDNLIRVVQVSGNGASRSYEERGVILP